MAVISRGTRASLLAIATALSVLPAATAAAEGMCHVVELDFLPAEIAQAAAMRAPSQLVAWIEQPDGTFVDTIFITQQTGTYGLGNRPGRFDFNSGPRWPYGRRLTVFPVWAHRHGLVFDAVIFQDSDENDLSHAFTQSSREAHYCRPLLPYEAGWDAATCASALVYSDKGMLAGPATRYPPRNDLEVLSADHPSVEMFAMLNPFDAVSRATPPSGTPAQISWAVPPDLPAGDYVMWLEVSREFDHNATYSVTRYPAPSGIPWADYGAPYRGQPSVVYQVPFTISPTTPMVASVLDYVGYGDPDGLDGALRAPDDTITTGVAGSGAERLAIRVDGADSYRLRVASLPELDFVRPAAPEAPEVNTLTSTSAIVQFVAPGDDDRVGKVASYEIRYVAGTELTEASFASAVELKPDLVIGEAGTVQEFPVTGLLHDTSYAIGIRAVDDCGNVGALAVLAFRTPERGVGEVDACFVATAAYGSPLANDVEPLRRFRDLLLQKTVLGELVVEAYYTFGPAVSGVVGESELLRATARSVLDPVVAWVKVLPW